MVLQRPLTTPDPKKSPQLQRSDLGKDPLKAPAKGSNQGGQTKQEKPTVRPLPCGWGKSVWPLSDTLTAVPFTN